MSGHRRRTSTSVSPPAGLACAGGAGVGGGRGAASSGGGAGVGASWAGSGRRRLGGRWGRVRPRNRGRTRLGDRCHGVLPRRRRGGARHRVAGRSAADGGALLQPVDPRHQPVGAVIRSGQQHSGADQLEQQPGCGRAPHLGQAGGDEIGGAAELGWAEPGRLRHQPLALVDGAVDQACCGGVGDGRHDDEVTQPAQQVLREAPGILTGLDHPVDHLEHGGAVTGGERVDHVVEQGVGGVAEQPGRQDVGHPLWSRSAEELVEDRQAVSRGSSAGPHDQRQRGRLDRDAFLLAQLGQVLRQQPRGDQPEGVVVGARTDRRQHLVGLGGGEDEAQVRRRLLDQLEQGVEALRGHHVGLIDDVDLVLALHRREERLLAQVAGVVDAAVGGRVDLDHVDRAGAVACQVAAAVALTARIRDRGLLAVESTREDPRGGGLATAAWAGEEVGVVDPVVGEGGSQRCRHVLLSDDVGERLGPVAPVQREG